MNPRSGRAMRALPAVRSFAANSGASVVLTERSRHATELAQHALQTGVELVVAVGGDGTMNEVASALVATPAVLGLVPCGSGNGLGRHLKIHGSVRNSLELLRSGAPQSIDSGLADGHPFFTAAGMGFEAKVALEFNHSKHRGFLRYLSTSTRELFRYQCENYAVTHPGGCTHVRAFTLAIANSDQYGNNAIIAPGARADDGQLDLCAIPPLTVLNSAPLLARLFLGTINRQAGVFLSRAVSFVVERSHSGPIHTDGEIHEAGTRISFEIRPASLRIMAPRASG
ncbi:MAG: diacylglycerol kinase family protein [Opitutus sp.]